MTMTHFVVIVLFVVGYMYMRNRSDNAKFQAEMDRINALDIERKKIELTKLQSNRDKYKTNHVLHLLLSLFTLSIWVIPWFLIARSNANKRDKVDKFINAI
jgi:preprotein translocase subunit YajC